MRTYVLKRLLLVPPTMLGITFITFLVMRLAPGDPAQMKVQPGVGGQQKADQAVNRKIYEKTLEQFDLDKPWYFQYLRWVGKLCGVKVEVQGAKHLYKDEVTELLVGRFRAGNLAKIESKRKELKASVEADWPTKKEKTTEAVHLEVERQLGDWINAQSEEQRFKLAAEVNEIRQNYIAQHGAEFEKVFWYEGLAWNTHPDSFLPWGWYPLDFGRSFKDDREVWVVLADKLPKSMELAILSILLAYIIAIPVGIHSATHQMTWSDAIITTFLFVLYSLPNFWIAIVLLLLVSEGGLFMTDIMAWQAEKLGGQYFDLFPVKGLWGQLPPGATAWDKLVDHVWHLALPVFCLTYGSFAYISRQMRAGMLEVIRSDYIRTARAKGLSERVVVFKHALRNSLIPILTIVAFILPAMVGGSVIIETIFNIDGVGKLSFEAILQRDYPIVMSVFTLSAILTLVGILLSDLLYAVVDPQISFEGR